jgi:hypothetical protein
MNDGGIKQAANADVATTEQWADLLLVEAILARADEVPVPVSLDDL